MEEKSAHPKGGRDEEVKGTVSCLDQSRLVDQSGDAGGTNILSLIEFKVIIAIADNAGRLMLFQYDRVICHVNLQGVALCDIHGTAQLDGQHDAP